ncbi:unnamed protein product [Boreogadus saida]
MGSKENPLNVFTSCSFQSSYQENVEENVVRTREENVEENVVRSEENVEENVVRSEENVEENVMEVLDYNTAFLMGDASAFKSLISLLTNVWTSAAPGVQVPLQASALIGQRPSHRDSQCVASSGPEEKKSFRKRSLHNMSFEEKLFEKKSFKNKSLNNKSFEEKHFEKKSFEEKNFEKDRRATSSETFALHILLRAK